jgi:hypothetical protein
VFAYSAGSASIVLVEHPPMKLAVPLVAAALLVVPYAVAQSIPDGTKVRIEATGLGAGWLAGKVQMNEPSGCTYVYLDQKQPGGYTMVALNSVARMERQDKGAWVDVPVKPLLAREKASCRKAAND